MPETIPLFSDPEPDIADRLAALVARVEALTTRVAAAEARLDRPARAAAPPPEEEDPEGPAALRAFLATAEGAALATHLGRDGHATGLGRTLAKAARILGVASEGDGRGARYPRWYLRAAVVFYRFEGAYLRSVRSGLLADRLAAFVGRHRDLFEAEGLGAAAATARLVAGGLVRRDPGPDA